jgi:hypothetical protein
MKWPFAAHVPQSAHRQWVKSLVVLSCLLSKVAYGAITGVWANEGGDKVAQDELRATKSQENRTGYVLNSIWNGASINLAGAHNEEVSVNVVLENGTSTPVNNVSVRFDTLYGPNGAQIHSIPATGDGVFDWTQRPIELFYLRYVQIQGLTTSSTWKTNLQRRILQL